MRLKELKGSKIQLGLLLLKLVFLMLKKKGKLFFENHVSRVRQLKS
jgi:hypothetical protein